MNILEIRINDWVQPIGILHVYFIQISTEPAGLKRTMKRSTDCMKILSGV